MKYIQIIIVVLIILYSLTINSFNTNDLNIKEKKKVINSYQTMSINIPKINLNERVYLSNGNEKLDEFDFIIDTNYSFPGEGHKTVITGHRENKIFHLKDVKVNDKIIIRINNKEYKYIVDKIYVSKEYEAQEVLKDNDKEELIIYTCYPFIKYSPITGRYIIRSKIIE